MLAYVNTYANAIGFADVDEISEYPNLKTVPIQSDSSGGVSTFVQPSVATVNSGTYGFATPEDLYTSQNPSLQVSAFLSFLNSPAEMKQLATQNQGYIPCDDLGTADAGDCANP
jgi:ABC-type phosphate transport system substrate-binding protein